MATGFDFEDYYVNEKVKTDTVIDRSGVNLQSPTENAEIATNNVIYYVSDLKVKFQAGAGYQTVGDGYRICVAEYNGDGIPAGITPAANPSEFTFYYAKRWHPLGELGGSGISSEWEPGLDRETVFEADEPDATHLYYLLDTNGTPTPLAGFILNVYPRHMTEANAFVDLHDQVREGNPMGPVDQTVVTDARLMRLLYGALGISGGRWKGIKWLKKIWNDGKGLNDKAVIPYDTFRKRLNALAEICNDNDVGFTVTYYDQTFARKVTAEDATRDDFRTNRAAAMAKHKTYLKAVASSDITRTGMGKNTTFSEAYGTYLPAFLDGADTKDFFAPIGTSSNNETALIPPVSTAVKAYFYQADELEDQFSELFKSVMDRASDVPVLWRFVKGSTKNRIRSAYARYKNEQTGSIKMAFDLEHVLATLIQADAPVDGAYDYSYCAPRMVQVGSTQGGAYSSVIALPTVSYGAFANITQSSVEVTNSAGSSTNVFRTYKNAYGNSNRIDKVYRTEVSLGEILDTVTNYYNLSVGRNNPQEFNMGTFLNPELATQADTGKFHRWLQSIAAYMISCKLTYGNDDAGITSDELVAAAGDARVLSFGPLGDRFPKTEAEVNSYTFDVICWEDAVTPDTDKDDLYLATPQYTMVWHDISEMPFESFTEAMDAIDAVEDAYSQMKTAAVAEAAIIGPVLASTGLYALDQLSDDLDDLLDVARKMRWYQTVIGESPLTNKSSVLTNVNPKYTAAFPAHLMFPVSMYKKVRVRYKKWFRTRHKTVKRSIGVRWAEVTFYDTSVYSEYPTVAGEAMERVEYTSAYEVENGTMYLENPLPENVVAVGKCAVVFAGGTGEFTVTGDSTLLASGIIPDRPGQILFVKIPLAASQPDGNRETVEVSYRMPGLPYDSEIRKKAFVDYGTLSQDHLFEAVRNTGIDEDRKEDGWRIFYPTSNSIEDLRQGLGLHEKVAMLLSILRHEFGDSRVQLVETMRSMDDQASMCSGGPESAFLSWHNYGLAVRILILREDGKTPIEKGDPEASRLSQIARAFTECCSNGSIGKPCNLVWCARLVVGPSLFDWEFLPIGVGHKDAPKFRDAAISQTDPVLELSYVDVDSAGYVVDSRPDKAKPYVNRFSATYTEAEVHGGNHYVSPDNIRNFPHVSDIVLYDAKEFLNLVRLKMSANGTALPASGSIYDWKAINPNACEQLIRYYAMTGSIAAAKALIAGDYVEEYLPIDEQYFNTDPIEYVKGMLGRHYDDVRIFLPNDGEASYITLRDGILHVKSMESYPDNPPTRFDLHKQQKVDGEHMRWGVWEDGVFYSEDEREIPVIDSEGPVIDGYSDGVAVSGEAMRIHQVLASKIHRAFNDIKDKFESFSGSLMYDRIEDGPNANMADMLENEFGLIKAQDLLSFDELDTLLGGILDATDGRERRVIVDGSIYEKVVNNAQLAGIRKASLTKEHLHIKDMPTAKDAKTLYDLMQNGRGYTANDLLK